MSLYLVQSNHGAYHLGFSWPHSKAKVFRKGILCFKAPVTLFKTRLEAQQALDRTRRYADRYYPQWHAWVDTSYIVRARVA